MVGVGRVGVGVVVGGGGVEVAFVTGVVGAAVVEGTSALQVVAVNGENVREEIISRNSSFNSVVTGSKKHITVSALTVFTLAAVNHKSLYEHVPQRHVDLTSLNCISTLAQVAGAQVYACNLGLCGHCFSA